MIATNLSSDTPASRRLGNKRGQTLVEYALTLAFISVVAISVLITMGSKIKGVFTTINSQLAAAKTGGPTSGTTPPPSGG
jgi:Flp pilus assembly pilin Flp